MPEFNLEGLKEVQKLLKEFPKGQVIGALKRGIEEGALIVQQDAINNVPVDRGFLRDSIQIVKGPVKKGIVTVKIRAGGSTKGEQNTFYGKFMEFGFTTKNGRHIPGKRFLTNAFINHTDEIVKKMTDGIITEIKKLAAKHGKHI